MLSFGSLIILMCPLSDLDSRLKEIKERCEAATGGPWDYHLDIEIPEEKRSYGGPVGYSLVNKSPLMPHDQWFSNRQFIAHARTDVPMLLVGWETAIRLMEEHGCFCEYKNGDPDDPAGLIYECMGHELQRELEKIAEKYK